MKNRLPSLVKKAEPVRHQFSSSSSSSSLDTMSIIEAILSASAKGRRTRRFRSALGFRQTRFGSRLPVRPRALGGNDEEARIPRRLFAALLRFRYALTLRLSRLIRYCRVNLSSARTPESLPDESVATVCADASSSNAGPKVPPPELSHDPASAPLRSRKQCGAKNARDLLSRRLVPASLRIACGSAPRTASPTVPRLALVPIFVLRQTMSPPGSDPRPKCTRSDAAESV